MSYCSDVEGYGDSNAGAGANPEIYIVTSLADTSTPGTLRYGIETAVGGGYSGKLIIFAVAGTITVGPSRIETTFSNLEIAADVAPFQGVQLKGHANLTQAPLRIIHNNVRINYLRSRPGPSTSSPDGIQLWGCNNVVLHHCEFNFAMDENVNVRSSATNITFQWCIIGLALNSPTTSFGMLLTDGATNITCHHCLFIHNYGRNPRIACPGPVQLINCIIYNAGDHPMTTSSEAQLDLISCVYIQGVDSFRTYIVSTNEATDAGDIYISDNVQPGATIDPAEESKFNIVGSPIATPSVHTVPSEYVLQYVLPYVGAILPVRDSLSQQLIDDVLDATGTIIDNPSEVGGWPTLTTIDTQFKITDLKTLIGTTNTINKVTVEFYDGSDNLVHTDVGLIGKATTRSWSGGPTKNINKRYAIQESIRQFALKNPSLMTLPATARPSSLPAGTGDPDGWLSDPELAGIIDEVRSLI